MLPCLLRQKIFLKTLHFTLVCQTSSNVQKKVRASISKVLNLNPRVFTIMVNTKEEIIDQLRASVKEQVSNLKIK